MDSKIKSICYKIALLLLLIALASIYNYFTHSSTKETKDVESPSIDYFASNIDMIQFKEDGNTEYKMTAEKLEHVQSTDIAYLTNPTANLHKEKQNPWFIRSDLGEIGAKANTVKLINNIKGTQVDNEGKTNAFEIGQTKKNQDASDTTKYGVVMIYPDKKYAESKDYTIVTSDQGQTSGVGMKAHFDTNQIQFLSRVQTYIKRG